MMVTLAWLLSRHEWEAVDTMLSSFPIGRIEIDESVLHLALRFAAPHRSVELLALRYPLCLAMPDPTRKHAFHVA